MVTCRKIVEGMASALPNLEELILTNNSVAELVCFLGMVKEIAA